MELYGYELKKLISSVSVWVFLAACLMLNVLLALGYSGDGYAAFVGAASRETGYRLEKGFYESLKQLTAEEEMAAYLEQLQSDTNNVTDVFDGYQTEDIGERYITATGARGGFAAAMRNKYAALQKVVDEKAEREESLTLYFAGATYNRHQQLFNSLMGWLLLEGALLSALLMLLSVGYEHHQKTEELVYSTKTGRPILGTKLSAALSAGLGAYVLLASITMLVYFKVNDYGDIWGSSVSSLFNYRYDIIAGYRPFVTWYSFSVLTYLLATLAVGGGVIACFSLMAFPIGVLISNHYIGFLSFLSVNAGLVLLPVKIPQSWIAGCYARYFSMLSPVWLWLKHSIWFTDGDGDILWPHFELLGLGVSFVILMVLCLLAKGYFRKRDVA